MITVRNAVTVIQMVKWLFIILFIFISHLADAFIQSDLQMRTL